MLEGAASSSIRLTSSCSGLEVNMATEADYKDVVIIGAGISGIDIAVRLQQWCPDRTFQILEAKDSLGGTWELFKYPGVRSDSDLHTFGFAFKPWDRPNPIAEGPAILQYLRDTTKQYRLDDKILYNHRVRSVSWDGQWTLELDSPQRKKLVCGFVVFCTGYYDHDEPLKTVIPGLDDFKGRVVHPQFWPTELDYNDKDIVIIGSGATAITLLPNLAKAARHVTQLQRSPSYVVSQPREDAINTALKMILPWVWAAKLIRIKSFVLPWLFYLAATAFPNVFRKLLKAGVASQLPKGYAMDPNFEPKYDPWAQRLCVTPEGDYFRALSASNAEILTANIDKITSDSIVLKDSDRILNPDIIITATGLKLQIAGGIKIIVDGKPYDPSTKYMYRGSMLQDLPNAAFTIGYTNASWTLGSDVTAHFLTRLLNKMTSTVTPRMTTKQMSDKPIIGLNSTYVAKGKDDLPKTGDRWPWTQKTMYLKDLWDAKLRPFTELEFT